MRVALIGGVFRPRADGVADYTLRLAQQLRARDVDVFLLTSPVADAAGDVQHLPVGGRWRPRDIPGAAARLAGLQPDVVHVQFGNGFFAGQGGGLHLLPRALESHGVHTHIIMTMHESPDCPEREPEAASLSHAWSCIHHDIDALAARARTIFATNQQHEEHFARSYGSTRMRRVPVPPNVLPGPPDPCVRRRLGIGNRRPLIVTFGFLHPVKGLEYLVRAFARVAQALPSARLVIAGGSQSASLSDEDSRWYAGRVRDEIRGHRLEGKVLMPGYLPPREVSALLQEADLGALAFTYGLTPKSGAYAAMLAHGLPIVGTRGPMTPRHLPAELAPPRDGNALGGRMLAVLTSPAGRTALAQASLAAGAEHSWDNVIALHLREYDFARQLVASRTPASSHTSTIPTPTSP